MPDVYEQHRASFAHVSAFVVLHNGERFASVAFKYPRDGAGRLYAYVHRFGEAMRRGHASGYGYDKRTAACSSAATRGKRDAEHPMMSEPGTPRAKFWNAIAADRGPTWDSALREAGFEVWQAV